MVMDLCSKFPKLFHSFHVASVARSIQASLLGCKIAADNCLERGAEILEVLVN